MRKENNLEATSTRTSNKLLKCKMVYRYATNDIDISLCNHRDLPSYLPSSILIVTVALLSFCIHISTLRLGNSNITVIHPLIHPDRPIHIPQSILCASKPVLQITYIIDFSSFKYLASRLTIPEQDSTCFWPFIVLSFNKPTLSTTSPSTSFDNTDISSNLPIPILFCTSRYETSPIPDYFLLIRHH